MNVFIEPFNSYLPYLKGLSVFVTLLLVAGTAYIVVKTQWLKTRINRLRGLANTAPHAKRRVIKSWNTVQVYLKEDSAHAWKLAVLQADVILDDALRAAGVMGKNVGERLKNTDRGLIANLDALWDAHKLRNRIAHEEDLEISHETAVRAVAVYEETFRALGLID